MEEEEEICRVCRSEATPEQPLFHPCKCSGSIRHVHQDCLIEWLTHSRKKYCELCEYPFTFTPVYREDMPEVLPARLYFLQVKKKFGFVVKIISRGVLVSSIWLIALPYFTIWIWRLYFYLAKNISNQLLKIQQFTHQLEFSTTHTHSIFASINTTTTTLPSPSSSPSSSSSWFQDYTLHSFFTDCFEGQIITCVVIVIFVAVFLLREWIIQNIPMDHPILEDPEEEEEEIIIPQSQPLIGLETLNPQQNDQRYDSLFDLHQPSSPTTNQTLNSEHTHKINIRSVSVSSPSYLPDDVENPNQLLEYPESISSMEPQSSSFNNNDSYTPVVHIGQPPNAPLLTHTSLDNPHPILEDDLSFRDGLNQATYEDNHPPSRTSLNELFNDNDEMNDNQPINNNDIPPQINQIRNDDNNDDDDEENMEEFEGILEAIGMQGSLWSLVQNSALMALLITLSVGVAVWLPYLIGIIFIMSKILELMSLPFKLVRLITDPLVDFIVLLFMNYVQPHIQYFLHYHLPQINLSNNSTTDIATSDILTKIEPLLINTLHRYQSFATGQTATDRFACIMLGYMIVTIIGFWYLARSGNNRHSAMFGRTIQELLRHQGIMFKVGMFITIELILFPIVCGSLLDVSALPLFKEATLWIRYEYLKQHPVSFVFLHWYIGTAFMFLFALLVTLCREVVRSGVMWFIRDPNDPQFHPIREIIERPMLFQLRKIGASALIYMSIILLGVGGVIHFIDSLGNYILPLRWDLSSPLSVIPIDLIAVQVGFPAVVTYLQPKQAIKNIFVTWMTFLCCQLRLTSFIFGGRHPKEEGSLVYHSWVAWLKQEDPPYYPTEGIIENIHSDSVSFIWNGQLLRVPRHDSVPIIERRRMLVPLNNYTLEPIDETERRLGHPASTAPGGDEVNTIIVYAPTNFKQRIFLFVVFMWLSISIFFCTLTALPVVAGRYIFENVMLIDYQLHDAYSFILGAFTIVVLCSLANQVVKTLTDIFDQSSIYTILPLTWMHIKQWNSWIIRWIFFSINFGIVIPVCMGMMVELYTILPLREFGRSSPTIQVLPMWAYGFTFMIIVYGCLELIPNNELRRTINNIFENGIHQMKLELCIKKILGPLITVSLTAIGLPFATAYMNIHFIAQNDIELRIKLFQAAYPIALMGVGTYYLGRFGSKAITKLAQNIREDNYLVGRTLHNLN